MLHEENNKFELAKAYYEYSFVYSILNDYNMAKELLEKAFSEFDRMGMKLWAEKCRKALQELDQ